MDILLKSRKPIDNYIHERAQSTCQLPVNDMDRARERGISIIKKFSGIQYRPRLMAGNAVIEHGFWNPKIKEVE